MVTCSFNYFILEKMSLMEKLAFVKDVYTVSRAIAADIESINAIRNALAHAFFPETSGHIVRSTGQHFGNSPGRASRASIFSRSMDSIDSLMIHTAWCRS